MVHRRLAVAMGSTVACVRPIECALSTCAASFRHADLPATVRSRLPSVGTTIFTVMSQMAEASGAINLSQGFPDFQADDALFERVSHWMRAGANQYAPMAGVPSLREAIVAKVEALYGARYDPQHEVTVVAGATQGLFTAIAAMISPGDEVIVFEPGTTPMRRRSSCRAAWWYGWRCGHPTTGRIGRRWPR